MYIPITDNEFKIDGDYLYDQIKGSNKYRLSEDIIAPHRDIILMQLDKTRARAAIEGIQCVKCVIVNKSILDGRYHLDRLNPQMVATKTVYFGEIQFPLDISLPNNKENWTPEIFKYGEFVLTTAVTTSMGLWSTDGNIFDYYAPKGLSVLSMHSMIQYLRHNILQYNGGSIGTMIEVSFDGVEYEETLPLPSPVYFSKIHAQVNNDTPILTSIEPVNALDIFDDNTTLIDMDLLSTNNDNGNITQYDSDDVKTLSFYDDNNKLIRLEPNIELAYRMKKRNEIYIMYAQVNTLFSSMYKEFTRYQLRSLGIMFVNKTKPGYDIMGMNFSYTNPPPKLCAESVVSIKGSSEIMSTLIDMSTTYGFDTIMVHLSDIKIVVTMVYKETTPEGIKSVRLCKPLHDYMLDFSREIGNDVNQPLYYYG